MEEITNTFPFKKLKYETFLTLDVMINAERSQAFEFMFCLNKEARAFLFQHYSSIKNGFINEGLIIYNLEDVFNRYEQVERLYFEALKRNFSNRKLTMNLRIYD